MRIPFKSISYFIIAIIYLIPLQRVCADIKTQPKASRSASAHSKENKLSENNINLLKQYLTPINTFQANFLQTTKSGKESKSQTSRGNMQMKRPDCFLWKVNSPFAQLYVSNGSKLWTYDKALQQVTIQKVDKQADSLPVTAILNGSIEKLAQLYLVKVTGSKDKTFTLTPKDKSSLFKELKFIFAGKKLTGMFMADYLESQTRIEFSAIKENVAIPDKQFTFIPPKGVDVLDETK